MNYIIGLDVGIGSIGWSVLRNDAECKRIEDFGVRIFDSGELDNGKNRKSQDRRRYRSARRLVTRRSHRKHRLKAHLVNIGFVTMRDIDSYFESADNNIIKTRVKGLDEKLSPAELVACLIHICNYRGFSNFYDYDAEDNTLSEEERKEIESEYAGANIINEIMSRNSYRSVAEMYDKDPAFVNDGSMFRRYRNRNTDQIKLVDRKHLINEFEAIMAQQRKYYSKLTDNDIAILKDIIFTQRDFETGPGNDKCKSRKYMGFLDSIGKCRFYRTENKGNRGTVIADIYTVINALSQCLYFGTDGKKLDQLPTDLSSSIIEKIISSANLTFTDLTKLCKEHNIEIKKGAVKNDFLSCSFKYIPNMKKTIEKCGLDWNEYIYDYLSEDNILNKIGTFLSENITPSRRAKRFYNEFPEIDKSLAQKLINMRISGTANVCNKYMLGVINSFINEGVLVCNYQYEFTNSKNDNSKKGYYKLPAFKSEEDNEFFKNPVVFRSINETRKIVNAIIDRYGSPSAINIEVASELNRAFEERMELTKRNNANEKKRNNDKKELEEKFGTDKVSETVMLRYRLWEQQGHKCLYSGKEIPIEMLVNNDRTLEIDHIMPFSLVLDDTMENKSLVYHSENQLKGQRTPLMYLSDDKRKAFIATVNKMLKDRKISKKKYDYLMAESFDYDIIGGWKSRNINDTRYISKYLKNYFKDNLLFAEGNDELYRERVYAVKAALTSRFRRAWLNPNTWGTYEKDKLKEFTYLDHAVDAIVVANLIPAYAEIAQVQMKLARLYKKERRVTDEYKSIADNCVETMFKFYRMNKSEVRQLIENRTNIISPLIERLYDEVDLRICDIDSFNYFDSESKTPQKLTDEKIYELFRCRAESFYADDPEFAKSIEMPVTSHKQSFKLQSSLTKDQAISVITIDGKEYQRSHKAIEKIERKHIESIYSGDESLKRSLYKLLDETGKTNVGDALKAVGKERFVTDSGMEYRRVTLLGDPTSHFIKEIGSHDQAGEKRNYTALPYDNYYCLELYRTTDGKVKITGIYPADITKCNGKMYLKPEYSYPEDYAEHIGYLHKRDYIELYENKKGKEICYFKGYFNSCKNVNANLIKVRTDNESRQVKDLHPLTIKATTTKLKKVNIDILGKRGGYIRCGEPLSLLPEKK